MSTTRDVLRALADRLADVLEDAAPGPSSVAVGAHASIPATWRERLWSCPPETRLGVAEVVEALGRPKSWVYRHTGPSCPSPIPHRRLDGVLVFTAGELRSWVEQHERKVSRRLDDVVVMRKRSGT